MVQCCCKTLQKQVSADCGSREGRGFEPRWSPSSLQDRRLKRGATGCPMALRGISSGQRTLERTLGRLRKPWPSRRERSLGRSTPWSQGLMCPTRLWYAAEPSSVLPRPGPRGVRRAIPRRLLCPVLRRRYPSQDPAKVLGRDFRSLWQFRRRRSRPSLIWTGPYQLADGDDNGL